MLLMKCVRLWCEALVQLIAELNIRVIGLQSATDLLLLLSQQVPLFARLIGWCQQVPLQMRDKIIIGRTKTKS